jgi:hypothetical protein
MDIQQKNPKHYASLVGCNSRERLGFVHSLMLGTVEVEIKQQISSARLIGGSAWLSTNITQRKWKKNTTDRSVPTNTIGAFKPTHGQQLCFAPNPQNQNELSTVRVENLRFCSFPALFLYHEINFMFSLA